MDFTQIKMFIEEHKIKIAGGVLAAVLIYKYLKR